MTGRKIKTVLMNVPESELMGDVFLEETGEPVLPVHVNIVKLRRLETDIYYVAAEDGDTAVKRRQLANAKERLRVRSLNAMFALLKRIVPVMPLGRRPSKVDMLRAATEYIRLLSTVLQDSCNREIPRNILQGGNAEADTEDTLQTEVWTVNKVLLATGTVANEPACAPDLVTTAAKQPSALVIHCVQPAYQYVVQFAQKVDQGTLELSCPTQQELTPQCLPPLQLPFQIQAQPL